MIRLHYQLNQENLKELNCYLALHDKSMQKKLLALILSICIFLIVLCCIIFRFSKYMLILSFVGIVLVVLLLPRIYWNMVFKRMDHFVENTKIDYNRIDVRIDEKIHIQEGNVRRLILFEDIVNYDYTKNNCILFYKDKTQINTLVIPVHAFTETQLQEFHFRLMEKSNGKRENN